MKVIILLSDNVPGPNLNGLYSILENGLTHFSQEHSVYFLRSSIIWYWKKWPLSGPQCTHTLCSRNTRNLDYCQLKQFFLYTLFLATAKVHPSLTESIKIIGRSKAEAERTSGAKQNLKSSIVYKLSCHSSCTYLCCGL